MKDINLDTKFHNFMERFEGSTSLDNENLLTGEKADYLILNGKVIIEIKTLTKDREKEVAAWMQKKIVDRKERRKGMPLLFGSMPINKILESHNNPEYFFPRYFDVCARTIKDLTGKAKKQIENTKKQMGLADSLGILVILNPDLDFYSDEFVANILREKFTTKIAGQALTAVVFIMGGFSISYIITDSSKMTEAKIFLEDFMASWIGYYNK